MRIIFLLQDVGDVYGAEQATADLALGLSRCSEVDVEFFLIEEERLGLKSSPLHAMLVQRNFTLTSFPVHGRFSRKLIHALRRHLEGERGSILHCVGPKANLHGGWAASWGRRFPVVATVHGWLDRPDLKEMLYTQLERVALRRMSAVIVLSRYYEELLLRLGFRRSRLHRIPSGFVSGQERADRRDPDDHPIAIGMLARLSPEKNHEMLLRAARTVLGEGQEIRLLLAGEGPARRAVESTVRACGLDACVEMPGYMDRDDFFSAIDLLVLCSRLENLPFSIMEAMSRGLPVVAAAVGGVPDLVEDGVTGYLVEPGRDDELARRLLELAKDRDARVRMGAAAREKLETEFSPERCVTDHVEMYRGLLDG